jgi:tRNA threonylcarbamoyladenosine biosynthesis protein TsaE
MFFNKSMQLINTQYTLNELASVAIQLIHLNQKTLLFNAPMGAGKTTLIKEICLQLGSTDNFSSPTYQLVNEYLYPKGKIFHFDLYRLKSINELLDIGFEDYISQNNYCLIEWPTLAEQFLKSDFLKINITTQQNIRYLSATKF